MNKAIKVSEKLHKLLGVSVTMFLDGTVNGISVTRIQFDRPFTNADHALLMRSFVRNDIMHVGNARYRYAPEIEYGYVDVAR